MDKVSFKHLIHRRLGKDRTQSLPVHILRQIFDVVADQDTDPCHTGDPQIAFDLIAKLSGLDSKFRLLLNKYALYAHVSSSL